MEFTLCVRSFLTVHVSNEMNGFDSLKISYVASRFAFVLEGNPEYALKLICLNLHVLEGVNLSSAWVQTVSPT